MSIFNSIITKKISYRLIVICIITIFISCLFVSKREEKFLNIYKNISSECSFTGVVTKVEKETQYYRVYIIKIQNIGEYSSLKDIHVLLRVKKDKQNNELKYGDIIKGVGSFEKPEIKRNYKGFDYSQYLKTRDVYLICIADSNNIIVVKENSFCVCKMCINSLRSKVKHNLLILLPERPANIAIALLLGDTSFIEKEQRTMFNDANLSHILAISGMHVSYVIAWFSFALKYFDKRKSKYIFMSILILFSFFTGGSPSVVRAVIMSIIFICSKLVYRKSDTLTNIALSALILLIYNPYNILNLGFQLSFLGTLGIVLFNPKVSKAFKNTKLKRINSLISVSISANLMLLPVISNIYNYISGVFLISNILVSPILGPMCFIGYITSLFSLISINFAHIFAYILNVVITIFEWIAKFSSSIDFLRFTIKTPSILIIIAYYFIIFYVFFYHKKKHNKLLFKIVPIAIIIMIIINMVLKQNGQFRIHFVDVGQGDCTVIVTESNKTIIIDGGGSESGDYDVGENVLVPYLLDRGITKIDYMVISHFDSDHVKGLLNVIQSLKVKNAIISKQEKNSDNYSYFLRLSKEYKINVIYVEAR
ncbi:MAG: ComEC/Rec2 family competence protein [Clostridia bacterium]|nr:ComEC/Rec2 family competence protein [Clostridia bacterium]